MTSAKSSDAPKVILKYDADKAPMDLLDPEWLLHTAQVLDFGSRKYKAQLWRQGMDWSRVIASASRHLNAINSGEDLDPETGLPHTAHLSCCAMFLDWYLNHRKEFDNRYTSTRTGNSEPG